MYGAGGKCLNLLELPLAMTPVSLLGDTGIKHNW
jgi:hypothetical protein